MQKNIIHLLIAMMVLVACTQPKGQETGADATSLPPVAGFVAYSTYQPKVFVPFGDYSNLALDSVAPIHKHMKSYNLFIYKNDAYDVVYDSEQASELKEDQTYLNDYLYRGSEDMKGYLYTFDNDSSIMIKYLYDQDKTVTEDDWNYVNENNLETYASGLLVTKEWMKNRHLLDFQNLSDYENPQPADSDIVSAVQTKIARKIVDSHTEVLGDGWQLCVMQTDSNGKDGVGVWALEYGDNLYLYTKVFDADEETGEVCWSMSDNTKFWGPEMYVVLESDGELLLYGALFDEATVEYMLLSCSDGKINITNLGTFNMPI
ncbi:MAG: hypothetical protein IKH26_11970 [Bacteroidaceae bacterium]|nr:hypothetical protein [Bacteroidaceae bacterium]